MTSETDNKIAVIATTVILFFLLLPVMMYLIGLGVRTFFWGLGV